MSDSIGQDVQAAATRRSTRARIARIWREIGPARLGASALFLLLAMLIARLGWDLAFVQQIERVLYDVRATYAMERVEEDPRILLVVYDENTLFDTGVRSPLDRAILARALANIDAMGARGIAIDILFDQPTAEDGALSEALAGMRTPTFLALVSSDHNELEITPRQEDFLAAFIAGPANPNVRATSVYFRADEDNVMRNWTRQPDDLPPLMANSLAPGNDRYRPHQGSIIYRLPTYADGAVFTQLPIDFFADRDLAGSLADVVRDRYVLIGTDLQDRDQFETPFTRITTGGTIPGLAVHAHLLAQMLDGFMLDAISPWQLSLIAIAVIIAGALTSLGEWRLWVLIAIIALQIAFFALFPFTLQRSGVDTQDLPVFGMFMGWILAYATVGAAARSVGSDKRRFVQGALARYLPGDVARQLVDEPERLSLTGEKRRIHALFTDLEGFTELSHAIPPEEVAKLLNGYLDLMSDIVLDHGGTLDKFVGDAIVAFWGAPIARPGDANRAACCAVALAEASAAYRPDGLPVLGRTRIGLHAGEAIVGNFGGDDRIQYTALGDAMNTAARLESANKQTGGQILVSAEAIEGVESVQFRPLGRVTLAGRATPVEIFEPVSEITAPYSEEVQTGFRQFEQGDRQAVSELEALAAKHPEDAALGKFVYRLRSIEPGGSYVLEGK